MSQLIKILKLAKALLMYYWNLSAQIGRNNNTNMKQILIILSILAICFAQLPTCPNGNLPSDVFSGKVTLALSEASNPPNIILATQDLYTYVYSLPLPFRRPPTVAIAINNLQSNYSQSFSFSVKFINTQNKQNLTFVAKIDHKISNWTKLSFNFLAETRDDIMAFSYDVSPNQLVLNQQNKTQTWVIPYFQSWTNFTDSTIAVYINGFQLFSTPAGYPNNSFEIRVIGAKISQKGLTLTINSSSTTQIDRIYLSFVVFNTESNYQSVPFLNLTAYPGESKYLFSSSGIQLATFLTTSSIVAADMSKYSYLYGFSSFSMDNNPQLPRSYSLDVNLATGDALSNTSASDFTLLQNNFLFFKTQQCSGCLGYHLYDTSRNQCVAFCPSNSYVQLGKCKFCPPGSHLSGLACITCGLNQQWDGSACKCITGYIRNNQNLCDVCPIGTILIDGECQCPYIGQTFDEASKLCLCPPQMYVLNGECQQCEAGKYWDGKTCTQICSKFINMKWDGSNCVCKENFALTAPNTCTCTGNLDQTGNCIHCRLPNTVWSGTECVCRTGYKKNTVTGSCILDNTALPPVYPNFPSYPGYPNYPYYPPGASSPRNSLITIQGAIMTATNTLSASVKLSYMPPTLVQNGVCNLCSNIFIVQTSSSIPFKTTIQYNGVNLIDNQTSFTISLQFDYFSVQNFNIFVKINPAFSNSFGNMDISQSASKYIDIRTLSTTQKDESKNVRKDILR